MIVEMEVRMLGIESHLRLARPSSDLAAAERFYVDGLGLDVLFRKTDGAPGEHDLLMLGWTGGTWHLELTRDPSAPVEPTPTVDDLLVLYLGEPVPGEPVDRLRRAGGEVVAAHNPYWDTWGVTVADPDGYRLVLCERSWSA